MAAKFRPSPLSSGPSYHWVFAFFLIATVCASAQPKYANKLAPYVTSPQRVVDRMLEMAGVKPGELVYDLGCGDGRVLITAAQRYNARAVGVEINDKLVKLASDRIAHLNLQDRAKVIHGDLMEADLSGADVVVLYLMTGSNSAIRPKLEKSLKPGYTGRLLLLRGSGVEGCARGPHRRSQRTLHLSIRNSYAGQEVGTNSRDRDTVVDPGLRAGEFCHRTGENADGRRTAG